MSRPLIIFNKNFGTKNIHWSTIHWLNIHWRVLKRSDRQSIGHNRYFQCSRCCSRCYSCSHCRCSHCSHCCRSHCSHCRRYYNHCWPGRCKRHYRLNLFLPHMCIQCLVGCNCYYSIGIRMRPRPRWDASQCCSQCCSHHCSDYCRHYCSLHSCHSPGCHLNHCRLSKIEEINFNWFIRIVTRII